MTRQVWMDLARDLGQLRARLLEHATGVQRRAHIERVIGVDLAACTICRTLRARSSRFDGRRFMSLRRSSAAIRCADPSLFIDRGTTGIAWVEPLDRQVLLTDP